MITKYKIDYVKMLLKAYMEGKTIQCRIDCRHKWQDYHAIEELLKMPNGVCFTINSHYTYRIKPSQEVFVPFETKEEMEKHIRLCGKYVLDKKYKLLHIKKAEANSIQLRRCETMEDFCVTPKDFVENYIWAGNELPCGKGYIVGVDLCKEE